MSADSAWRPEQLVNCRPQKETDIHAFLCSYINPLFAIYYVFFLLIIPHNNERDSMQLPLVITTYRLVVSRSKNFD